MTKTVLNVGLPVKTFYIQGLIAPENSTLIRYPMKKFLFNTLFAAMVVWQLSSIAATPEFIESERKAFQDVKLGGAGNVWSAEGRWTNGVPGQGENILYRTGLGYRSNNAQSGHDTDLVVDMDRYIYVDEVSTNAPIRVSYFSFNNHWNIPTTLSSIDGKTLEIMVNSDPQYMAFGFGLLGLESLVGSTGAFLEPASSSTPTSRASEYIDTFVNLNLNFCATGEYKRAGVWNNSQGVMTFVDGNTINADDLTLPDYSEGADGTLTYSELKASGMLFETTKAFNKYHTGGDLVINSTLLGTGQTLELREGFSYMADVTSINSVIKYLPYPKIIVGGTGTNTFKTAIVSTDVRFAKQGGATVISDANPSLIIERGAVLTYDYSDQVPSNTAVEFRTPVSEPVYSSRGVSTSDECDNIAGTLELNGNSQNFGALRISRLGKAPTIAVVDFGDNDANQVVSFQSFETSDSIKGQANKLLFKNYKMGGDHIYIKEKPASGDDSCIYIVELTTGKESLAGAQYVSEELGWEYIPDVLEMISSPDYVKNGDTVTLKVTTTLSPIVWYKSTDGGVTFNPISGATSDTYSFIAGDAENKNAFIYKCTAGTGEAQKSSAQYRLDILSEVQIIEHPQDVKTNNGQKAIVSIKATGSNLKYQWYFSEDGVVWTKIEGATSAQYEFVADTTYSGKFFRCEVSNPLTTTPVVSNAATVVVGVPAVILANPQEQLVISSTDATFTCLVENGTSIDAYWQVSKDGGASWSDVTEGQKGYFDSEEGRVYYYTFTTAYNLDTRDGKTLYRCAVLNAVGTPTFSDSAPLYAYFTLYVLQEPEDCETSLDGYFTFTAKVICYKDTPLVYNFQMLAYSGNTEYSFSTVDASTEDNVVTITYPVGTLGSTGYDPLVFNGASCVFNFKQSAVYDENNQVVHSGANKSSKSATLYIYTKPNIVTQPKNVYISEGSSEEVVFSVEAVGSEPMTYQWQRSLTNGQSFTDISGANEPSYTETSEKIDGAQYRCVIKNSYGTTNSNAAYLYIRAPIILDENNPADASVGLYGSATFNVIASVENSNPITYQWYVSMDGSDASMQPINGATSSSLTLTDIPFSYNGYKYMCEVSNASDPLVPESMMTVSSRVATLTVSPTPIIVQQPVDVSVIEGNSASFNVVVNGGKLTYTWYYSPDGGVSWISIPNSNSPTYTVSAEYDMKGWLYYCEISYPGGVLNTNQVSLAVSKGVTFIEQPQKFEAYTGEEVTFSVKTYCPESGVTFKWQYSFNGWEWIDFVASDGSHKSETLTFTATDEYLNAQFRCVAYNYMGIPFYSDPAILWIYKSVVITRQIDYGSTTTGVIHVGEGIETTLSVGVEGQEPITYLWQYQRTEEPEEYTAHICKHITDSNSGTTCDYVYDDMGNSIKWNDLPDDWVCPKCGAGKNEFAETTLTSSVWYDIPNSNSSTHTFVPTMEMNAVSYRVIASNKGGSAISNPVTLSVHTSLTFNSSSGSQMVFEGDMATFSVDVGGENKVYTWYVSYDNGISWQILAAEEGTLTLTNVSANLMNSVYYCEVSNGYFTVTSPIMQLGVFPVPVVSPEKINALEGSSATFSVTNAMSQYQTLQWMVSKDGGNNWEALQGQTSTELVLSDLAVSMDGYKYRCDSTTTMGSKSSSNVVELFVSPVISITKQPATQEVLAGDSAEFEVVAEGAVGYEWQYFDYSSGEWLKVSDSRYVGMATSKLSLPTALYTDINTMFRCRVYNEASEVFSASANLVVKSSVEIEAGPQSDILTYVGADSITLSVEAEGKNLTYDWQKYNESTGKWESVGCYDSVLVLDSELSSNGLYRCYVSNAGMGVVSSTSNVVVAEPSEVLASMPKGYVGGDFTLSVAEVPTAIYQWQSSPDGSAWSNIGGANASTLQLSNLTKASSGTSYRCLITTNNGQIQSDSFKLEVIDALVIKSAPQDTTVPGGADIVFEVVCESDPSEPTAYQWQLFSYETNEWVDIDSETNPTLELLEQREEKSGILYRCKISNRAQVIYTDKVALTVGESIAVVPEICYVELDPDTQLGVAEFSVENYAGVLSYQWQVSSDNGLSWIDVSGATSQTLRIEDVPASYNGYKYRCVMSTPDYLVKSLSGQIAVDTAAKIVFQPESQVVDAGNKVSFMVVVSGDVEYQWQKLLPNASDWINIEGATSSTYEITALEGDSGTQYRCVATSIADKVNLVSLAAHLTVINPVSITINQEDDSAYEINAVYGSTVYIEPTISSPSDTSNLVFEWQSSTNGGKTWNSISTQEGTSKLTLYSVTSSAIYRCVVSNGADSKATSKEYKLNIYSSMQIVEPLKSFTVARGSSVEMTFKVSAPFGASLVYFCQIGNKYMEFAPTTSTTCKISLSAKDVISYGTSQIFYGARIEGTSNSVNGAPITMTLITGMANYATTDTVVFASKYDSLDQTNSPATFVNTNIGPDNMTYTWSMSKITVDPESGEPLRNTDNSFTYTESQINGATDKTYIKDSVTDEDANCVLNSTSFAGATGIVTKYMALITTPPIEILKQPVSVSSGYYGNVVFEAAATVPVLSDEFQKTIYTYYVNGTKAEAPSTDITLSRASVWQVSTDGGTTWSDLSGENSDALSFNEVTPDLNGNMYRIKYYNYFVKESIFADCVWNVVYSEPVKLEVLKQPVITKHPDGIEIIEGSGASFTVDYVCGRETVQWQVSTDGGNSWSDISGANSKTYSVQSTYGMDGNMYRCYIMNTGGVAFSNAAKMSVGAAVVADVQPQPQTQVSGEIVEFVCEASTEGNMSYQWQISYDMGATWTDFTGLAGSEDNVLRFVADESLHNAIFRCKFTSISEDGSNIYAGATNGAVLHVLAKNEIIDAPTSVNAVIGGTAELFVEAAGQNLSYQWQKYEDGFYKDIEGATSSVYAIANVAEDMNGQKFRCLVYSANVFFDSAEMTLNVFKGIDVSNVPEYVEGVEGESIVLKFDVANATDTTKYIWKRFDYSTHTWVDVTSNPRYTISGSSLTINSATLDDLNAVFSCTVEGDANTVTTSGMNVVVYPKPTLSYPAEVSGVVGGSASIFVEATGTSLTYVWQVSKDGGSEWEDIPSATSATYTVDNLTSSMNGYIYKCTVSDRGVVFGSSQTTLTVVENIIIDSPEFVEGYVGEDVVILIDVQNAPEGANYLWQMFNYGTSTWNNVVATSSVLIENNKLTLKDVTQAQYNNASFRCVVSGGGASATSDEIITKIYVVPSIESCEDVFAVEGSAAIFSISANGNELSYQWQKYNSATDSYDDIAGATASTYTIASVSKSMSGDKFRCEVSDRGEVFGYGEAVLTVVDPINVSNVPTYTYAYEGSNVTITFDVSNVTADTTYQWQRYDFETSTWELIGDPAKYIIDGNSLTVNLLDFDDHNSVYRCVVSNGAMSITTGSMSIVVYAKARFPAEGGVVLVQAVNVGQAAYFAANATGEGPLAYKWYVKRAGESTWTLVDGAESELLEVKNVQYEQNGDTYACVVSNPGTPFVAPETSAENVASAQLVVQWPLQVVEDVKSQTVYEGDNVTISFEVQGQPDITYEWYEYRNGQEYKLSNFTGPTMTVYTLDITDNGVGYYCKADNGISHVYSGLAVVTVKVKSDAPTTLVKSGTPVTMSVLTSAKDATYQWQEKNTSAPVSTLASNGNSDGWEDISGATSVSYTKQSSYLDSDKLYRCVVSVVQTDNSGEITNVVSASSDEIKLNVGETYSTWAEANGLAADSGDQIASGSVVTNVEKYIFAANGGTSLQNGVSITKTLSGTTVVKYPVAIYVTDAIVGVQYSTDMKTWTDVSATPSLVEITSAARIYAVEIPQFEGKQVFVRFKFATE